ncbi:MAG: divergent PAP2 family protein [Bacillota bacterium]|nr:divergent PAP2 family protein [Bacillota bacterium]
MGGHINLTGNRPLDAAVIAWLVAQVLKVIISYASDKEFTLERFVGAGGMPSSHSAFVMGLTGSILKVCGFYSPQFAIALCLGLVVMYDASGVRRAAGEQAKILNYMMYHWKELKPEIFERELKELLGHTPVEVFAGAILGISVGLSM